MLHPDPKTWSVAIRSYCVDDRHIEALSLFSQSLRSPFGFKPNHNVLAAVLKSCAALSAIKLGKALHGYVVKQGLAHCQIVSKALLNIFAKCHEFEDCKTLFMLMDNYDPVIWNIVLSGFSGSRTHDSEVMKLFYAMHIGGEAKPNPITIATVLSASARLGDLAAGRSLHSHVIKSGLETNNLVGNGLISMYAKCGLVSYDAYAAFNSIIYKDVVSWNAIIAGFAENSFVYDAFKLFSWMLRGPIEPNYATIATILPVCASLEETVAYHCGREIHGYALRRPELAAGVYVGNALVSFYLRLGRIKKAESLFQRMKSRDLVSWNSIIAGYASNGEWAKALDHFRSLLSQDDVRPDSVTIISILPACAHSQSLRVGKAIHGYIFHYLSLWEDTTVGNAMINFYAKCCMVEEASRIFSMMFRRDLISWNSMLDTFTENGYDSEFLNLLARMIKKGVRPDSITILTIINFSTTRLAVNKVKEVHCYSLKAGFLPCDNEPTIGNAILDAYAKCGNIDYACQIFQNLSDKRNMVTFNSLISGYVTSGLYDDACILFNRMHETDLTTWNIMIRAYAENDCPDGAFCVLHELHAEGMKPNSMTIMNIIPVCAQMASVHLLRQCHAYMVRACFSDIRLKGALLDAYTKCGFITYAYKLFELSPLKDLVMFTAIIGGFAMHGMGKEALRVFSLMLERNLKPDHVIITTILSACSHAGLVNEGLKIFHSMEELHGIKPNMEQYACVVDLLARNGQIGDAFSFLTKMPFEANANIWGTLLAACRTHHKLELGRIAADHLFEVEANNIGNYVIMSNLYAAEAKWEAVLEVRRLMKTKDLKKPAGCSWIEIERRLNVFISGDSSHPERTSIYSMLSTLDQQIKEPVEG